MRIIIEGKLSELKDFLYWDVDSKDHPTYGPNLKEVHPDLLYNITVKNVKIWQDQWTGESTPFIKLEGNDKVCMVDFHTNEDSSVNIEHKSDKNVISW